MRGPAAPDMHSSQAPGLASVFLGVDHVKRVLPDKFTGHPLDPCRFIAAKTEGLGRREVRRVPETTIKIGLN
jgi:hypothetical protein